MATLSKTITVLGLLATLMAVSVVTAHLNRSACMSANVFCERGTLRAARLLAAERVALKSAPMHVVGRMK